MGKPILIPPSRNTAAFKPQLKRILETTHSLRRIEASKKVIAKDIGILQPLGRGASIFLCFYLLFTLKIVKIKKDTGKKIIQDFGAQ